MPLFLGRHKQFSINSNAYPIQSLTLTHRSICKQQLEQELAENRRGMEKPKEEDNRREAAMASTLSLQPNFKPAGVTHQQLSKFQELHRRRLQIKAKSKIHKKQKDQTKKFLSEDLSTNVPKEAHLNTKVEDASATNQKRHSEDNNPFAHQDNVGLQHAPKRRQKLHWGLDTKERWERKANM